MTPEEEKRKKKGSELVQDASDAQVAAIRQSAEDTANVLRDEGQRQVSNMETAQAAQAAAESEAQRIYRERMEQGQKDFADIIAEERAALVNEQADATAQVMADQRAAKYTGLTELAAGVANLLGVGQNNAVSQVYKSYSQDWMRQADQHMRESRLRQDNMRNRLNSLRQQQINLKLGDAEKAFALAQKDAERNYNNAITLGQARYNAGVNPVLAEAQGREKAAAAELQGAKDVSSAKLNEGHLALQQQAQERAQKQFEATMRSKGYNPDGTVNPDAMALVQAYSHATSGSGKSGYTFPVLDQKTGKINIALLTKEQREDVFTIAKAAIATDLGEQEAKMLDRELQRAGSDDRMRNEVLQNWIGKSPLMAEAIRSMDTSYKGIHGSPEETVSEPPKTPEKTTTAAQDSTKVNNPNLDGYMDANDFLSNLNKKLNK